MLEVPSEHHSEEIHHRSLIPKMFHPENNKFVKLVYSHYSVDDNFIQHTCKIHEPLPVKVYPA
jgi:hypothetical protein